jgi:hypothetical protein
MSIPAAFVVTLVLVLGSYAWARSVPLDAPVTRAHLSGFDQRVLLAGFGLGAAVSYVLLILLAVVGFR